MLPARNDSKIRFSIEAEAKTDATVKVSGFQYDRDCYSSSSNFQLSRSLPQKGGLPSLVLALTRRAFDRLTRSLLSITGTRDQDVVSNGATADKRMAAFTALPKVNKAHLVLRDADHMTSIGPTGRPAEIVSREQMTRELQDAHHAPVAAITTDWWLATLLADPTA